MSGVSISSGARAIPSTASSHAAAPHAALPLILRHAEATRRRAASHAPSNELTAPLYAAPLPIGAPMAAAAASKALSGNDSCRALGYEVHWNAVLHAIPGGPTPEAEDADDSDDAAGACAEIMSEIVSSPQACCALCAAAAARQQTTTAAALTASVKPRGRRGALHRDPTSSEPSCTAWSYFAPRCYWAAHGCTRTLGSRATMWGAVSGFEAGVGGRSQHQ